MNKKGFTLVEIIVAILICSIVLMISGTMIVSSFKSVYGATSTNIDKQLTDSLVEVVRQDTEYAFDVRLVHVTDTENIPSGADWHYLYISNGRLVIDDVSLFPDSFYNNKELVMDANVYVQRSARVDFTYSLHSDVEQVYSTRDSILFLNVEQPELYLDEFDPNKVVPLDKEGYHLYYRTKNDKLSTTTTPKEPEIIEEDPGKFTVADNDITKHNYVGTYDKDNNKGYSIGSVVYFVDEFGNGAYWQYIGWSGNHSSFGPGKEIGWRKLDPYFDPTSSYMKNDVIIYNGHYYRAIYDLYGEYPGPDNFYNWEDLGAINDPNVIKDVERIYNENHGKCNLDWKDQSCFSVVYKRTDYVQAKYWPDKCNIDDVENGCDVVEKYDSNKVDSYAVGEIVKVREYDSISKEYQYYLYVKRQDTFSNPGEASSGWTKLSLGFDKGSTYLEGDIVIEFSNKGNPRGYNYMEYQAGQWVVIEFVEIAY